MSQQPPRRAVTRREKIAIGVGVVVAVPVVLAVTLNATKQHPARSGQAAPPTQSATAASSTTPTVPSPTAHASRTATVEPTFAYPGDPQCAITYRDRGDGSMIWIATVSEPGKVMTHATDKSGNVYSRNQQVEPGPNVFAAPVPLAQIIDLGGVLYTDSKSYACSIAPAR